jgi:hypothetical protein
MARPRRKPLVLPDNWRSMNALPLPLWAMAHGVSEAVAKAAVKDGKLRARRLSERKIIIFLDQPPDEPPEATANPVESRTAKPQPRTGGRFTRPATAPEAPRPPRPSRMEP